MDQTEKADDSAISVSETTRKNKSIAHDHFSLEENRYQCKYCKSNFTKCPNGTTTNLIQHLRTRHSSKISDTKKSSPIIQAFQKGIGFSQQEFQHKIAEFTILTNQPFTIVEAESFISLCQYGRSIPPQIPQRNAIKNLIVKMYSEEKQKLMDNIQSAPGKISITVDCWSTRNNKSFQGFLASFTSKDWTYEQVVLDMDILQGSHSGKKLAESILGVLDEFKITPKLLRVTCDNASNMNTMVNELEAKLSLRDIQFSAKNQRVRCLAHIVNLSCQDGLAIIKTAIPKDVENATDGLEIEYSSDEEIPSSNELSIYWRLKTAVVKIKRWGLLKESLKHFCETMNIQALEVVNDMKVRWNSTYKMLERCLKLRKALEATMGTEKALRNFILSDNEWGIVEEIVAFLEPFNKMTNKLSEQLIPSMSLTAVVYIALYNHLESYTENSGHSHCMLIAAKKACKKLNEYYPSSDALIYLVGIVLDPRCKFEWHKSNGYSSLVPGFKKSVSAHWTKFYKRQETPSDDSADGDLFDSQMKKAKIDSRDELEKYLSLGRVSSAFVKNGVLEWWKENESVYPDLSKMARDFLGVSATGVPVESLFSTGTDLLTSKRLAMLAVTIKICMCLKAWLKFNKKSDLQQCRLNAIVSKMLGELND